jgi:hypothetical protein
MKNFCFCGEKSCIPFLGVLTAVVAATAGFFTLKIGKRIL